MIYPPPQRPYSPASDPPGDLCLSLKVATDPCANILMDSPNPRHRFNSKARMPGASLALLRLRSQLLSESRCRTAAQVVTALGAMQAQDYGSAVWTMGCRIPGSKAADIEQAIRDRTIVRTWPMRGTLHFVPADDAHWMLTLLTPRVIASTATRVRQLELDDATFAKAERVLVKALQGEKRLTREDTLRALERAKISTAGGRGYHILFRLSMHGLLCGGPREGKQQTFVLLDEWLPKAKSRERDETFALLARRYFGGHGPATVRDFAWWSGLKVVEAKAALASVATELECHRMDGESSTGRHRACQRPTRQAFTSCPTLTNTCLHNKNGAPLSTPFMPTRSCRAATASSCP